MSTAVRSVRKDVAISGYHRTLAAGQNFFVLTPGANFDVFFENALGSDDLYSNIDESVLPGTPSQYENVLGHLVDIVLYTVGAGIEVYVHEAVNQGSGSWLYGDGYIVTPGLPSFERGFRISAPAARIRVVNAGAALVSGDISIRASTQ